MNKDEMLKRMCQFGLSQADIKGICKIRALPPTCLKSRYLVQRNLLNDTGIEKAMASLDERQTLFLHLLNVAGEETDIKFFTHLYKEAYPGGYGYTFNDKYKVVFNKVKTELIRKGLLLCAEDQRDGGTGTPPCWRGSDSCSPPIFHIYCLCRQTLYLLTNLATK